MAVGNSDVRVQVTDLEVFEELEDGLALVEVVIHYVWVSNVESPATWGNLPMLIKYQSSMTCSTSFRLGLLES